MPCLLGCLALLFPRLVIILLVLFTTYMSQAYQTILWPVLGFLFLPLTTLAYAFAINSAGSLTGIYLVLFIVAILIDLGLLGGGGWGSKRTVATYRSSRGVKRVKNLAD